MMSYRKHDSLYEHEHLWDAEWQVVPMVDFILGVNPLIDKRGRVR